MNQLMGKTTLPDPRDQMGANALHSTVPTTVMIESGDRISVIGPDTDLARAVGFPAGHSLVYVWRAGTHKADLFDATCTVIMGAAADTRQCG